MEKISLLDKYLEEHSLGTDKTDKKFRSYYAIADGILEHTNFLLFPTEVIKSTDEGKIIDRIFKCDLVVEDREFGNGIKTYQIEIDWKTLQNFENLKSYLCLQVPTVKFYRLNKSMKEQICSDIQRGLLEGFNFVYGCKTTERLKRLGFRGKNNEEFVFNNGVLNLKTGNFVKGDYQLTQNASINLTFPLEEIENLDYRESLRDILSMKKYISSNNSVSSIVIGYLVAGIFRNESKAAKNEFPFLGIQSISNAGKTSLLNFLSWVCGFNWETILGTNDSEFAFEVGMNCMSSWYYFFDEIQKASKKLLKYVQAAYNSGESHKGGGNGNWRELQSYRKDCNLICCGEYLPNNEEALLNRFIIIDSKEPFLIKKNVKDKEEYDKYKALTGDENLGAFLTTGQIKALGKRYYRPRFLNILRNKRFINFEQYYQIANSITEDVAKEFGTMSPDTRHINNLSTAIAGYMLLCGDDVNEDELRAIVKEYFTSFLEYRKEAYASGSIVKYIAENIGDFCSWTNKVKGSNHNCPMVYLKNSKREKGLAIQIAAVSRYMQSRLNLEITPNHIEQQLRGAFDVPKLKSKPMDIARSLAKMSAVFIDYNKIKDNEYLREIWDASLGFLGEHISELKKMKDDPIAKFSMSDSILRKLIEEMEESYGSAEFFNTDSYSKELPESEQDAF